MHTDTLAAQLSSDELEIALATLAEAYRAGALAAIDDDLSGTQFAVTEKVYLLWRAHLTDDDTDDGDRWDDDEDE